MRVKLNAGKGVKIKKVGMLTRKPTKITNTALENQSSIDFCLSCTALKCNGECMAYKKACKKNKEQV